MNKLSVIEQREVLGKDFKVYGTVENPLFLAKDVAEWIDYSKSGNGSYNVPQMLSAIDESEKLISTLLVAGQNREVTFLTEDGLYEVLMQSRKPIAKEFKKQVKEILRTIRKHGMYATDELLDNPDFLIETIKTLKEEGATKTKISNVTKLDVVEADSKLKEIYTSIIKEISIKWAI